MPTPTVQQLLDNITQDQSLNTWSLIMTLFGDAIVPRGGCVASSSLQTIMSEFNIDNGAVRTALSRLTGDGRLERERSGRNSFYSLAASQEHEFRTAELQIYTPNNQTSDDIHCSLMAIEFGKKANSSPSGLLPIALSGQLALHFYTEPSDQSHLPEQHCIIDGNCQHLPSWLLTSVLQESLLKRYEKLLLNFAMLDSTPDFSAGEAAACRCLLIHEWRRLRLKTPAIPYQLIDLDHPLRSAHDQVAAWYKKLLVISDQWWNTSALNHGGPLGPPLNTYKTTYKKRFGLNA